MRTLSQILGFEETIQELARVAIATPAGRPLTKKITPDIERISLDSLEGIYKEDQIIFNGINMRVEVIMSGKYTLVGDEAKVNQIEDFLDNIGSRGGSTEWNELLTAIFQHQCIYGRAFNEIIYEGSEVVDLDLINPKTVDYAKKPNLQLSLDRYGNPVGYVQTLPPSISYPDLIMDKPPSDVHLGPNQIFIRPEKIAHYKLFTVGDGFYGIGLIEPIYRLALHKLRLIEASINQHLQLGPTQVIYIGDDKHECTNELLTRTVEQLEKNKYSSAYALPDYAKMEIVEAKHPEKIVEELNFLTNQEISVLGPRSFITGAGEETNRSTLNRQEALFKLSLKNTIKRTVATIEKEIFPRVLGESNLRKVPRFRWGEIDLQELDSKAKRITDYVNSGVIKPDEGIERHVRKIEGLP